jgi:hypothetical protein
MVGSGKYWRNREMRHSKTVWHNMMFALLSTPPLMHEHTHTLIKNFFTPTIVKIQKSIIPTNVHIKASCRLHPCLKMDDFNAEKY